MAWGEGGVHDGREHMTAQSMQIALAGTKPGVTFQSCPQSPLVLSRSKSQRLHNLPEEYSWPGTKCSDTGMAYILCSMRIPHKDVSYYVEPSDRSLAENFVLWHLLCFLYMHSQPQSTTGCFVGFLSFASSSLLNSWHFPSTKFRASHCLLLTFLCFRPCFLNLYLPFLGTNLE